MSKIMQCDRCGTLSVESQTNPRFRERRACGLRFAEDAPCMGWVKPLVEAELPVDERASRLLAVPEMAIPILWECYGEEVGTRIVGFLGTDLEAVFPEPVGEDHLPEGVWHLLDAFDGPGGQRCVRRAKLVSLAARGAPVQAEPEAADVSEYLHSFVYGEDALGVSDEVIARMVEELEALRKAP